MSSTAIYTCDCCRKPITPEFAHVVRNPLAASYSDPDSQRAAVVCLFCADAMGLTRLASRRAGEQAETDIVPETESETACGGVQSHQDAYSACVDRCADGSCYVLGIPFPSQREACLVLALAFLIAAGFFCASLLGVL